jgi:hypothetical protein
MQVVGSKFYGMKSGGPVINYRLPATSPVLFPTGNGYRLIDELSRSNELPNDFPIRPR